MRRLLAVLCLELLVAFNCPAQNHATQNGASAAPQVSREDLLKSLHDDLQRHSNLHDTYLYLASIGTKETVLLLERLRLDYGAHEPPPGMVMGFDCAQGHLVCQPHTLVCVGRNVTPWGRPARWPFVTAAFQRPHVAGCAKETHRGD